MLHNTIVLIPTKNINIIFLGLTGCDTSIHRPKVCQCCVFQTGRDDFTTKKVQKIWGFYHEQLGDLPSAKLT